MGHPCEVRDIIFYYLFTKILVILCKKTLNREVILKMLCKKALNRKVTWKKSKLRATKHLLNLISGYDPNTQCPHGAPRSRKVVDLTLMIESMMCVKCVRCIR